MARYAMLTGMSRPSRLNRDETRMTLRPEGVFLTTTVCSWPKLLKAVCRPFTVGRGFEQPACSEDADLTSFLVGVGAFRGWRLLSASVVRAVSQWGSLRHQADWRHVPIPSMFSSLCWPLTGEYVGL